MESLLVAVNAIVPMFIVIAAGYIARHAGLLDESWLSELNRLIFTLLLSAKLFYSVYTSDFESVFQAKLIIFIVVTTIVNYAVIFLLVMLFEKRDEKRGVIIQAIYRSNFVIMGIPVVASLTGESSLGTTSAIVAIAVPLGNALAVFTLQRFSCEGCGWDTLLKKICTNPLIIGTACGLAVRLLGIRAPAFLLLGVDTLASAATPMALLVLGGFFHFEDVFSQVKEVFWCVFGKLILVPAIMLSIAVLMGFRGVELAIILAYFAAPCGPTSVIMTRQMGGDAALAGAAVVVGCILSCFTLIAFAYVLIQFGYM